jgi:hypothetical protein
MSLLVLKLMLGPLLVQQQPLKQQQTRQQQHAAPSGSAQTEARTAAAAAAAFVSAGGVAAAAVHQDVAAQHAPVQIKPAAAADCHNRLARPAELLHLLSACQLLQAALPSGPAPPPAPAAQGSSEHEETMAGALVRGRCYIHLLSHWCNMALTCVLRHLRTWLRQLLLLLLLLLQPLKALGALLPQKTPLQLLKPPVLLLQVQP